MTVHYVLSQRLENTFKRIEQRMKGIPVLNESLHVKAIGFHQWGSYQLGVLITPWFMNLMLLPESAESISELKMGDIQSHIFPSGTYDFIVGYEDELGTYLNCSLFSPMFEFEDQLAAELTAQEALAAIMEEDNFDLSSQYRTSEVAEIWSGEKVITPEKDGFTQKTKPNGPVVDVAQRKVIKEEASRRDFLRGKIFNTDPQA